MYISTAFLDDLLEGLNPDEDKILHDLIQGFRVAISETSNELQEIDSRLGGIENRLSNLE